jgi:N-acetylglucosaminyldiphosphoundecaprenol N-acetyl-beta-D-mannosaminyltransferase
MLMYLRYGDPSWDTPESPGRPAAQPAIHRRRDGTSEPGSRLPTITLHGVRLHSVTEVATVRHILGSLDQGRGGVVVTPNLDHLRRCRKDMNFAALVAEADLVVADGMPLVWASKLQRTPLPERVAGSNLISSLSEGAAARGRSLFLLGGAPGTADGAAEILRKLYPGIKITGSYCPPVGFERNTRVMGELHNLLTASKADIVYVALGSPKQERLIARIKHLLPNAWWLGVGNSFSFLCGHVRRAPMWMQSSGLEWVHRLGQEPRRLFKRYVLVGLPFGTSLLGRAVFIGISRRLSGRGKTVPSVVPGPLDDTLPNVEGNSLANLPSVAPAALAEAAYDPSPRPALSSRSIAAAESESQAELGAATGAGRLSRLRALVLLGGSVRPTMLSTATERSVLDLPLDEKGSLLNSWLSQSLDVAQLAGLTTLPVRVMVNQGSAEPTSAEERHFGLFQVERDRSEYRGTGGVLRDLAAEYDDEDLILVANAAQIMFDPLASVASALERRGGEVGLVSHEDGTPTGVMLLTCKTLRTISEVGYVDLKEQALPQIASQFTVRVLPRRRPTGLPIRSLENYIQGLRLHHRLRAGKPAVTDPLAEDWGPAFSLIEPGAVVGAGARAHDSVVLAGGVIEPGAVVVRCVVCPGGVVRRDRTAVDQFIIGTGELRPRKSDQPPGADRRQSVGSAMPVIAPAPTTAAAMSVTCVTTTPVTSPGVRIPGMASFS